MTCKQHVTFHNLNNIFLRIVLELCLVVMLSSLGQSQQQTILKVKALAGFLILIQSRDFVFVSSLFFFLPSPWFLYGDMLF